MSKVKKKVPRTNSATGTCILLTAAIVVVYFYLGRGYYEKSIESILPRSDAFDQDMIDKQYNEVVNRAASLSQQYKHMTVRNPTLQSDPAPATEVKSPIRQLINPDQKRSAPPRVDIVIGMAQDTDPKNLVTFCSSFRKYSTAAASEVVLFINTPVQQRSRDIAKKFDIQLIEFNLTALSLAADRGFSAKYHPSSLRWGLISKFFENANTRNRYSKVLLIDVRDSYFQSDPFDIIAKGVDAAFYVFKGVESITISECGWNGGWIKDCFGDKMVREIGHNNIICSGVSIGTMNSVFEYLEMMDDILMGSKKSDLSAASNFPRCERNGVDQGVHNVLVHTKRIKNLTVLSQSDGRVVNMQGRTAIVRDKLVVNSRGDKFAIVHQYDRYPDLQKALFAEYVHWVNTDDPAAEWKAEEACNNFGQKYGVDLFKARCDLKMKGGATSAASCCAFCMGTPGCQAFTFLSGTCHMKSCSHFNDGGGTVLEGAVSGFSLNKIVVAS